MALSCILCRVVIVVEMLVDRDILQVVVILFFAAQSKLCRLIELISVAFSWNIHHKEIFPDIFYISLGVLITGSCIIRPISVGRMRNLLLIVIVILCVHAQITVICSILVATDSPDHAIGTNP